MSNISSGPKSRRSARRRRRSARRSARSARRGARGRSRKPPKPWRLPSIAGEKVDIFGIANQQINIHFSNDNEGVKTKYQIMDFIHTKIVNKIEITRYELRKLREYLTITDPKKFEEQKKLKKTAAYILKIKSPLTNVPPFYDEKPLEYVGTNPFSKVNTDREDLDDLHSDDDIFIGKKLKEAIKKHIIQYKRILYAYSTITEPKKFEEQKKLNKSEVEKTSKNIIVKTKKRAKAAEAYSKEMQKITMREKLKKQSALKKSIPYKQLEKWNNILEGKKQVKGKWEEIDTWELPLYPFNDKITSYTFLNDETANYTNLSYGITKDWIPIGANPDMVRNYTSTIARNYLGEDDIPSTTDPAKINAWKDTKRSQTRELRGRRMKSPFNILIPKNTLVIVKRYSDEQQTIRNLHSVGLDHWTDTCEIIPYRFIYKHGIGIDEKKENDKFIPEEYPLLPKDITIKGAVGGKFYPRDIFANTYENLHTVKWIDSEIPLFKQEYSNMDSDQKKKLDEKYLKLKDKAKEEGEKNPGELREMARKIGAFHDPNYLSQAINNNTSIINDGKRGTFIVPCKIIYTDLVIVDPTKIKGYNPTMPSHFKGYYLNGLVMKDITALPKNPESMKPYPAHIDLLGIIDPGNNNIRVEEVTIPRCDDRKFSLKVKVKSLTPDYKEALQEAKNPSPPPIPPRPDRHNGPTPLPGPPLPPRSQRHNGPSDSPTPRPVPTPASSSDDEDDEDDDGDGPVPVPGGEEKDEEKGEEKRQSFTAPPRGDYIAITDWPSPPGGGESKSGDSSRIIEYEQEIKLSGYAIEIPENYIREFPDENWVKGIIRGEEVIVPISILKKKDVDSEIVEKLNNLNLREIPIASDGDCLFSCFKIILRKKLGIIKTVFDIRREIASEIIGNWGIYNAEINSRCLVKIGGELLKWCNNPNSYQYQMIQAWKYDAYKDAQEFSTVDKNLKKRIPRAHWGSYAEIQAFSEIDWTRPAIPRRYGGGGLEDSSSLKIHLIEYKKSDRKLVYTNYSRSSP